MNPTVPESVSRKIIGVHGEAAREWLSRFPDVVAECARRWSLEILPPFDALSYNYVAPVVRADGSSAVLKIGFPSREIINEIEALRVYDGRGAVRLLDSDPELGVLLLERLQPGKMLASTYSYADDDKATSIAAGVMRELWRPVPPDHPFPTVRDWASGMKKMRAHFSGSTGPLPSDLVEEAESLFADLLSSQSNLVLLHGDLHHYNILSSEREPWLMIDPKGVVGEPSYEIAAFLHNPFDVLDWPDPGHILTRRVDQFSEELGLDRERVRGWAIAHAVLSAWWTIEDNGTDWQNAITVAGLLRG